MTATMTSKGQITIPKEVRDRLNLKPGSKLDFRFDASGKVMMKPVDWEWRDLAGIVKSPFKRPLTVREMDGLIMGEVLKRDESSRHKRSGTPVHQRQGRTGRLRQTVPR